MILSFAYSGGRCPDGENKVGLTVNDLLCLACDPHEDADFFPQAGLIHIEIYDSSPDLKILALDDAVLLQLLNESFVVRLKGFDTSDL